MTDDRTVTIIIPWAEVEAATKSIWSFGKLGAKLYKILAAHVAKGWSMPS